MAPAANSTTPLIRPPSVPPLSALALRHLTAAGLPSPRAEPFLRALSSLLHSCASNGLSIPATWQHVARALLWPGVPFPVHELLYASAFAAWDERSHGPPPVWAPSLQEARETNLGRLLDSIQGRKLLRKGPHDSLALLGDFLQLQRLSYDQPELYWPIVLRHLGINFHKPPQKIFTLPDDPEERFRLPGGRWLVGAELNIAESCLGGVGSLGRGHGEAEEAGGRMAGVAREAEVSVGGGRRGRGRVAVVWRDEWEEDGPVHGMALGELREHAVAVACSLKARGIQPGDPIALALPMTVHAVAGYLGVVLAGAAVVSIADSFSAKEIAARLRIAGAKAIVTQDFIPRGGKLLPLYSRVVEAGAPPAIVLQANERVPRVTLREGDVWWSSFLAQGKREGESNSHSFTPVSMPVDATINVLFSSGTTGIPKAIPWSSLSAIKAAADAWAHHDLRGRGDSHWTQQEEDSRGQNESRGAHMEGRRGEEQQEGSGAQQGGDTVCWPTSLGWMMGPWLLFAALLNGATLALYNGSPLTHGFARFVQDARVTVLGLVPSVVRAWKASGCTDGCDWSNIRLFSSSGEASLPADYLWLMSHACYRAPIVEYCGGTEIGGAFITGTMLQPQALSCFSTAAMGCRAVLLGAEGDGGAGAEGGQGKGSGGGVKVIDPWEARGAGRGGVRSPAGGADGGGESESSGWLTGECALMPHMLGASWKLLNADHHKVYFEGMPEFQGQRLRRHGDALEWMAGGYWRAHGRTDDTMNLGGVKVGSVELERVCNTAHPAVSETAAIGVAPCGGGPEELVVVAVLRGGGGGGRGVGERRERSEVEDGGVEWLPSEGYLRKVFSSALQSQLNPLFKVSAVWLVPSLPRNASNKVMRRVLRHQFSHRRTATAATATTNNTTTTSSPGPTRAGATGHPNSRL
ncbi:hypothetical protein CLOP_g21984 [Closterium sp. NIES-67]|nr:hypothetical protein CLOP_g21984 [Closterium sp. NIES-67]